ncbi:LLM class oxidoreductase [Staphylococcus hominis]|uniref:LLM class oxidoreductase n=1 Tax=Staphylococcus hominis TaxID=1290 RepID=UPI000D1E252F|nr:LLM class oxidoreductase [Staphylococcus hominis]MCE4950173.1 LLM class oxidoreductase [Staphylococcus hominis]MCE4974592.1 LLM class oxidoreductase [Staphylococcus hominis]PTK22574.1 LLM class flavin-dependent oxidoreductase [Staphylococcus hominis]PTK27154.1 LLM class flavin-dependent oxidoreductase [Staphylococcus hominis]PTK37163.1 LLM class flavin-dependent oxidoreductase [Staphylococcus hominis]
MSKIENHEGFKRTFKNHKLTLGLSIPFDSKNKEHIDFNEQVKFAQQAERLGFTSLFVRDNPLYSPHLGPVTENYDPFVFLTYLSAFTSKIALGTSSIVATLRHPIHLAKSAASLDLISNQRLLLGMATGDRAFEFPAFKVDESALTERYQTTVQSLRALWQSHSPQISNSIFELYEDSGLQVLPKHRTIPMFGTGYSRQSISWLQQHMDGWLFYAQPFQDQKKLVEAWHSGTERFKPFMNILMIDLSQNPNETVKPIKGGFRTGRKNLLQILKAYESINTNHIILRFTNDDRDIEALIEEVGTYITPHFPAHTI